MSDLSDLDLVAQAMAPTDKPSNPTSNSQDEASKLSSQASANASSIPDTSNIDMDNLDLSSLTPEDLALLQPLLSALSMSNSDSDLLDEDALADVFKQMSAAGEVADDLEGKLDRLIGELGKVEEGILEGMDEDTKSTTKGNDSDEKKSGGKGGDGQGKVDESESSTADEKK